MDPKLYFGHVAAWVIATFVLNVIDSFNPWGSHKGWEPVSCTVAALILGLCSYWCQVVFYR